MSLGLAGLGTPGAYGSLGGNAVSPGGTNKGSIAALQAQIRRERSQLNDWVTCVSATTPKGKAEIQSLSSKISAAQEHIARIEATNTNAQASRSSPPSASPPDPGRIDTWA